MPMNDWFIVSELHINNVIFVLWYLWSMFGHCE